jgi:hypothetical protein
MDGSLLGGQRWANERRAVKQCHTVSCSSSTACEDGEVDNSRGMSLITALAPGRRTLMGGIRGEETSIVDSKGDKRQAKERRRRGRSGSLPKEGPISAFKFRNRGGGKIGDET